MQVRKAIIMINCHVTTLSRLLQKSLATLSIQEHLNEMNDNLLDSLNVTRPYIIPCNFYTTYNAHILVLASIKTAHKVDVD